MSAVVPIEGLELAATVFRPTPPNLWVGLMVGADPSWVPPAGTPLDEVVEPGDPGYQRARIRGWDDVVEDETGLQRRALPVSWTVPGPAAWGSLCGFLLADQAVGGCGVAYVNFEDGEPAYSRPFDRIVVIPVLRMEP